MLILYDNHTTSIEEESSVLVDKTKSGKVRPWREKKLANVRYFELLHILEFRKAARVKECGEVLLFDVNEDGETMRLVKAFFCKSRLCPLCNWRRSMKLSSQTVRIVGEVLRRKPKARWLFLTLTVKNVYGGEQLRKSLTEMSQGFNRLMGYKKVKKNLVGYMRSVEVTVNPTNGSYNQHMHVLLCVESTYFRDKDNYITQKEWTSLWQRAMRLDYVPVVHIQAIKPKNEHKSDIRSSVDEVAKYPVKDVDYTTGSQERDMRVVWDMEVGLHGKRLISYGGLMREIHKELHLDDPEDGDLVRVDDEDDDQVDEKAYSIVAYWNWAKQNYYVFK